MLFYFYSLQNYFNFGGRARRKEHILFCLINTTLINLCYLANLYVFNGTLPYLPLIYLLLTFIPYLSLTVRRLHDIGYGAWALLWYFVPILGWLFLFLWLWTTAGQHKSNKYGKSPK